MDEELAFIMNESGRLAKGKTLTQARPQAGPFYDKSVYGG